MMVAIKEITKNNHAKTYINYVRKSNGMFLNKKTLYC